MRDAGVLVTLNSDNAAMFDIDLADEYVNVRDAFGCSLDELEDFSLTAIDASWADDDDEAGDAPRLPRRDGRPRELRTGSTAREPTMTDASVDVVVVGGGHNGLICAAYLARAGLDVIVVEQNDVAGGALMSSEWQGHVLEHGAVEHTAVLTSGVIDELGLEDLGLAYRTRDVAAIHLFGDGTQVTIGRTIEATADSIATISARDARAWTELSERSAPLLRAFAIASDGWVPPMSVATRIARTMGGRDADALVELVQMSVLDLAMRWFESPHVRALAIFRASFLGLPPWAPGTANAFLLTTGGHGRRLGRPLGGSRAFVAALTAAVTEPAAASCGAGSASSPSTGSARVGRCGRRRASRSRPAVPWCRRSLRRTSCSGCCRRPTSCPRRPGDASRRSRSSRRTSAS